MGEEDVRYANVFVQTTKTRMNETTPIDSTFEVNLYSQFDIQLHVYVVTQWVR